MHEQGSGFSSTFRGTGSRVPSHVKNVEGNTCRRPPGGEVNNKSVFHLSTASCAAFSRAFSCQLVCAFSVEGAIAGRTISSLGIKLQPS